MKKKKKKGCNQASVIWPEYIKEFLRGHKLLFLKWLLVQQSSHEEYIKLINFNLRVISPRKIYYTS